MTLILAYGYIEKLIEKENFILGINNVYRLLLVSVVLAIKILEDNKYDNSEYCQIGGLSLSEFNSVEYSLATRLNFELYPKNEEIEALVKQIKIFYIKKKSRNSSESIDTTNSLIENGSD